MMRSFDIARCTACLLFLFTIGAAPQPLARIDAAAIDHIAIDITVSVLGPGTNYHKKYRRRDRDSFVSEDGTSRIAQSDLDRLADELRRMPTDKFDFSRTWITAEKLQENLAAAEMHYLGPYRSNAAAEKAFRAAFLDWRDLRAKCERAMSTPISISDFYPDAALTLSGEKTSVRITTHSQRQFLLPLTVSDGAAETVTWDPGLSDAIYLLVPQKTPLRDMFAGGDILANWAQEAGNNHDVQIALKGKDDTPPAFRVDFYVNPCFQMGRPYSPY